MRFPKFYAKLVQGAIETFYGPTAKEITTQLKRRSGIDYFANVSILDVGCGSGELVIGLASLNWSSVVTALDKSRDLLSIAVNNVKSFGLCGVNINFIEGDACCLPFNDNTFDFVVSSGVLHCVKNSPCFLSECVRVLRPGGDLWIYDPSVLILENEIKNPALLKKRLPDWRDRILLRFVSALSSSPIPPKMMSIMEVSEVIEKSGIMMEYTFSLRILPRHEKGYVKIEIQKF